MSALLSLAEIEGAAGRGRIGDFDAVQQHLGVVGIGAAHEERGLAALAAGLHQVEARHVAQHIGQRALLARLDVGGVDHRDRARDLVDGRGDAGGGDHHVFVRHAG